MLGKLICGSFAINKIAAVDGQHTIHPFKPNLDLLTSYLPRLSYRRTFAYWLSAKGGARGVNLHFHASK
jgi:hypothetical protein